MKTENDGGAMGDAPPQGEVVPLRERDRQRTRSRPWRD